MQQPSPAAASEHPISMSTNNPKKMTQEETTIKQENKHTKAVKKRRMNTQEFTQEMTDTSAHEETRQHKNCPLTHTYTLTHTFRKLRWIISSSWARNADDDPAHTPTKKIDLFSQVSTQSRHGRCSDCAPGGLNQIDPTPH